MNADEIYRRTEAIARDLRENPGGYKDDLAKQTLIGHVSAILQVSDDDVEIRRHCDVIRDYLDALFRDRPRKGYPDASKIRSIIIGHCQRIKGRVETLKSKQREH